MVIARSAMDSVPLWQSVLLQPEDEYLLFETSKTRRFVTCIFVGLWTSLEVDITFIQPHM